MDIVNRHSTTALFERFGEKCSIKIYPKRGHPESRAIACKLQ